jgi:hypothetical protein
LPWPNDAEGFVLRPTESILIPSPKGPIRPLLKRKHRAFEEDARYHQAQRWPAPSTQYTRPNEKEHASFEQRITELTTLQRAQNAISKIGRPRNPDDPRRAQIETLLQEDILTTLREEHSARWDGLSSQTQHKLLIFLREQARATLTHLWNGTKPT